MQSLEWPNCNYGEELCIRGHPTGWNTEKQPDRFRSCYNILPSLATVRTDAYDSPTCDSPTQEVTQICGERTSKLQYVHKKASVQLQNTADIYNGVILEAILLKENRQIS